MNNRNDTPEVVRPGDGFLAEAAAGPDLPAHQQTAGEVTMVERDTSEWRSRAACRTADPETFFPVAEAGRALDREVARAKRVCDGCPVQPECRAWSLDTLPYGIAGGMTADERREVRRSRQVRAERPAPAVTQPRPRVAPRPSRPRWAVIADGQAAIAAGTPREQVARDFGVSRRTVDRWAAELADRSAEDSQLVGGGVR
ncbi:hypothetical protein GCM10009613_35860 [Pseudonocardia kongjuensis]|uniref:Transcriptional regulator WhiB n=1 Tax=Pseudonocardia kongjuensis TaxID=102227 RepID=A0ABP4IJA5_9PSEU